MATIGIDITPIQGPHRMRGVGSTVINVLRHITDTDNKAHTFVFYAYQQDEKEALDLIDAASFANYEVRTVPAERPLAPSIKTLTGLLYTPERIRNLTLDRKLGSKRITDVNDLDVFLQFEQDVIPPSGVKTVVIAYDLIPYVLESDYLWSYSTARKLHNYSRHGALKAQVKRDMYLRNIRSVMKRSYKVIAISNHTKGDFVKFAKTPANKIEVCHLGISDKTISTQNKPKTVDRYVNTSWGDVQVKASLPSTPFLLFVGGADPRRKLTDLIHAFNLLRAQGHSMHLVLAGDTMLGPNSIPNAEASHALLSSSYLDDIYMLGFVNDATREWLYQNALAFVYPSKYEGFGLPILEAMQYGTPVITYKNSSIFEIAENNALYANDSIQIAHTVSTLAAEEKDKSISTVRIDYAKQFNWSKTAYKILEALLAH